MIATVIVNMERWRWLPRQLGAPSVGNAYVILNIPDFTLKVMQNGAQVWTTQSTICPVMAGISADMPSNLSVKK